MPKQGIKHRHGNGAFGIANNGNENSIKNTSKPAIKHKKINNIQFASAFSKKLGKCKFQFPYSFLSDSRVFNIPITREDIVGVEFDSIGKAESKCINGLLNDRTSRHDFNAIVNHNYLKKLGITDKKWRNKNLVIHFGVGNERNQSLPFTIFKNGIMTNAHAFLMSFIIGEDDTGDYINTNTKYIKKILTKSYYAKHSSSEGYKLYSDHFVGKNGTNKYYLSSQEKAVATLSTSNPLKKYVDLKVKLISGEKKRNLIDGTFISSDIESNTKKVHINYVIKGDARKFKGKKYKVIVTFDLKFKYGVYTNIGATTHERNFKKDVEVILSKNNNWRSSSKIKLPDIESSSSSTVIGFRMNKKFEGIDSKIFIKSIQEIL